ncbi:YuzD family protein [Aquibacillus sediminis]|uniref:YuzD family protein n=1 Tax=Aquibacillus sediminis TaxID=2574734 RepID=UPI001107F5EB|nr:YuzD family protein [Aquibacillus sediminis]
MSTSRIVLTVYGADRICASCVNAPGSKETYEWLQAAIARKYETASIEYEYIDIDQPPRNDTFIEKINNDELFYPLVLVNGEIVAEGIPRLKPIYHALEQLGVS